MRNNHTIPLHPKRMESPCINLDESSTGKSPAKDFLRKLSAKSKARFLQISRLLEENGTAIWMPYSRHLEDGIFEVRIITGNESSRILYFFTDGQRIIFTNGFFKKTQKTPRKEIETAIRYRADYLRRNVK